MDSNSIGLGLDVRLSETSRRAKRRATTSGADAYALGQSAAASMAAAVDAYLDPRLTKLRANLLDVFRQRLETICDEPDYTPQQVVQAELRIFQEQLESFTERMQQEVAEHVADWHRTAELTGVMESFRDYVAHKANTVKLELLTEAVSMGGDAVVAAGGNRVT